jgi:hypothetical protein
MSYGNADTSAKVGFRPYHQTDPFGASHLSGLGEYYRNRPFDPWELAADAHHVDGLGDLGDLGQNHPFKPQAWHLHGLGATDAVVEQAVQELVDSHQISSAEGGAILDGSMTFQDVLGFDPTDQNTFFGLTDLFREVHQTLVTLENEVVAANVPGHPNPALATVAAEVTQMQNEYTNLSSQFVYLYTAVAGSAPTGLSGLGLAMVVWWGVVGLAAIVALVLGIYALHNRSKAIDVSAIQAQAAQTQATSTAATNQSLLQKLAVAQAAGDTVTAQAILKTLAATGAQPNPPSTLETWLMTNAKWIGLGAAGLIFAGPLASGLFGGRRR